MSGSKQALCGNHEAESGLLYSRHALMADIPALAHVHRRALETALPGLPNVHSHEEDFA